MLLLRIWQRRLSRGRANVGQKCENFVLVDQLLCVPLREHGVVLVVFGNKIKFNVPQFIPDARGKESRLGAKFHALPQRRVGPAERAALSELQCRCLMLYPTRREVDSELRKGFEAAVLKDPRPENLAHALIAITPGPWLFACPAVWAKSVRSKIDDPLAVEHVEEIIPLLFEPSPFPRVSHNLGREAPHHVAFKRGEAWSSRRAPYSEVAMVFLHNFNARLIGSFNDLRDEYLLAEARLAKHLREEFRSDERKRREVHVVPNLVRLTYKLCQRRISAHKDHGLGRGILAHELQTWCNLCRIPLVGALAVDGHAAALQGLTHPPETIFAERVALVEDRNLDEVLLLHEKAHHRSGFIHVGRPVVDNFPMEGLAQEVGASERPDEGYRRIDGDRSRYL
mmetsp:Transcript_90591/g.255786  ORF Transcript_90591/g.255786 Transcript_90591/m.255786 type:complete len:397 (+) Transcript_90591:346-1536(+)